MVERRFARTAGTSRAPAPPDARPTGEQAGERAGGHGADDAGDRVIRAVQRFARSPAHGELARALYHAGDKELTPTQVDALETLTSRPHWRMHEFAKALGVNPSVASRTTDRLIRLDLAERHADDTDRRYVIVRATASGRRISRRIQRDRYALMQEVMDGLSAEQRIALADMLEYVTATMELTAGRGRP